MYVTPTKLIYVAEMLNGNCFLRVRSKIQWETVKDFQLRDFSKVVHCSESRIIIRHIQYDMTTIFLKSGKVETVNLFRVFNAEDFPVK